MSAREWLALVVLLLAYCTLGLTAASDKSPSYDEPLHLTGGYTYWTLNDYRVHAENGLLPQRLAALPLLGTKPALGTSMKDEAWISGDTFEITANFMAPGTPIQERVMAGRRAMVVAGVGVILVVFFWARALWGARAGWIAGVAGAFCPTLLAHGPQCTSDVCAAFFFALSAVLGWRALHRVTLFNILAAGAALGALFLSKMSAPLGVMALAAAALVRVAAGRAMVLKLPGGFERRIRARGRLLLASFAIFCVWGVLTCVIIWAGFGFRYSPFAPGMPPDSRMRIEWKTFETSAQTPVRAIAWANSHRLLPEAYLWGAAQAIWHSRSRVSFLLGNHSVRGQAAYFPFLFATKTPLGTLGLLALGSAVLVWLGLQRRGLSRWIYPLTPILILGAFYMAASLTTSLNIGHRHLLPLYPLVYIFCGGAACWIVACPRARAMPAVLVVLTLGIAAESTLARPNYLAFFNATIGVKQSYRYVVDSNNDWGQELPALKKYLEDRPGMPRYYIYFGGINPLAYGVPGVPLINLASKSEAVPMPLQPGVYCVGATMLQGVGTVHFGRWDRERETYYQKIKPQVEVFWRRGVSAEYQAGFEAILREVGDYGWGRRLTEFSDLRVERLCSYLRHRTPDDNLNGAILVYYLDAQELTQALEGPPRELLEANFFTLEKSRRQSGQSSR